ncbi:MAG: Abi family protein [Betaproteobacteria bacterium]|nr:Abi family protein [Betaproteobacteria bacterium]
MMFEFLIAYHHAPDTEIVEVIRDVLSKVLEDNLNEFDGEAVERMVVPSLERPGDYLVGGDGDEFRRVLFGFTLDLPEETGSIRTVVDEFSEALNTAPVVHLVKFDDPLIRADLARWADEIYALEMKLRRVLTLVYLHAYQDGDPYDLLSEESTQTIAKERPKPEHMKDRAENQFFHLTFSQYVGLNRRPEFKLPELLELIRDKEAYDALREELARAPVEDEDDAVLLAGLKERMEAIEAMRNCCAHSRRPSKKVIENYDNARPLLDQLLDSYLVRWEWSEPVEEMPWDAAAREAVEHAMEHARWDEENQEITLFDADDDRMQWTASGIGELQDQLAQIAASAFYANAPREGGEFVFECDEYGVVESVLDDYRERLEEFFKARDDADD